MKIILITFSLLIQSLAFSGEESTSSKKGFKLISVKKGSLYQSLGLQQGDILKSYDNEKIRNVTEAMNFYKKLNSGKVQKVILERDGKEQIYNIE